MTDAQLQRLIAAAQQGNGEAAGQLYDRYHAQIYRFVHVRLASPQAAEDLTAEVFIRMVDRLTQYDDRGLPFGAWLYQIARNLLIDSHRRREKVAFVPLEEAPHLHSVGDVVERAAQKQLLSEQLLAGLERLESQEREVLELRFLAGLTAAETAEFLAESLTAVKSRQHRALKHLRALLPPDL